MIKKNDTKSVKEFLTKTGFILEMQIAEILRKLGYNVKVNSYFQDYDENKKREIDIIATKKINDVYLYLVIECKQSLRDDWIFIHSDRQPARYYQFIKHLPQAKSIKETKLFDNFHQVDASVPLTQNYIIKDKEGKKSTSMQIENCLEKLPKIIVEIANSSEKNNRNIFFPIAIFGGNIFIAKYTKQLSVKNTERLQYEVSLESENYTYNYPSLLPIFRSSLIRDEGKENENSPVARTCQRLGSRYLIDFVTKKGFLKLIHNLEEETNKLDLKNWTLTKEDEEEEDAFSKL